ncbi:hypothetical protein EVAR_32311_1 [Eumeta japonica]|uniref:Uncharacterized protein n=1 Tax=Eumeta variegata TaxID=151549 RepID=A0A4C1ZDL0_EUMVA|nr:hypothetical protein EVAR_32311_1 [Eumeta japonica]
MCSGHTSRHVGHPIDISGVPTREIHVRSGRAGPRAQRGRQRATCRAGPGRAASASKGAEPVKGRPNADRFGTAVDRPTATRAAVETSGPVTDGSAAAATAPVLPPVSGLPLTSDLFRQR